ncbi:MAG: SIMPL domain-containing protein [Anaerolineae bacterium]
MKQLLNWKTLLLAGLTLASVMALALGYARVTPVAAAPATQDTDATNTITVRGFGKAFGAPDVALVRLGANVMNADIGGAVAEVNRIMTAVRDALRNAGVAEEDLQTAGFNVWSEDRFDPQAGAPTGERVFRAENTLLVTVRDVTALESVIDAALDAGATNVFGLNFSIDDTASLEREARVMALEDARARAEQIAQALGVTLGEAITVDETYRGGSSPQPFAAQGLGGGGGPLIEEGQLAVGVDVTVTYRMAR